ncbi:hypothetical protein BDW02DRAFT_144318 [Decorospora gaudefroyi]|uniref:Uncharacterized protein n=1 Tax=Decorospora gaudefroyi TaxID=184978 RepID=A0A6A5JXJ3_9PLEO|nr:hypothetical protein BDW02DRAFT_144318 [Decorospora gaudefroyi]
MTHVNVFLPPTSHDITLSSISRSISLRACLDTATVVQFLLSCSLLVAFRARHCTLAGVSFFFFCCCSTDYPFASNSSYWQYQPHIKIPLLRKRS